MRRRQPLPRLWMMTDERQGAGLIDAVRRLPRGSGIVFRHYRTPAAERRALFKRVQAIAASRDIVMLLAGETTAARAWHADGSHGRRSRASAGAWLRTAPAHDLRELAAAHRASVDLVFVSPVFATRTHPGGRVLGRVRALLLARYACVPAIALGGMTPSRARSLPGSAFHGWAAIDAWSPEARVVAPPIAVGGGPA